MKKCSSCKKEKEISEFYVYKRNKDGHYSYCRDCASLKVREWRKKNPRRNKEIYMKYHGSSKEYRKKYYRENKERIKENNRLYKAENWGKEKNRELLKEYGITLEEYYQMFENQGWRCKICGGSSPHINGKPRLLDVDHDHVTGRVRGLLCRRCNLLLGKARDEPELLRKAILYLENK